MPASKLLTTYTKSNRKYFIDCVGDSYTRTPTLGMVDSYFYPRKVQDLLRARGCLVTARNFGVGGDSSAQILNRAKRPATGAYALTVPALAIIYSGASDLAAGFSTTVQASPTPTTTAFAVGASLGANFPVGCNIKVGGQQTKVTAVATDTLTVSPALSGAPAAATAVVIDTQQNIIETGTTYTAAGCSRLVIVNQHYMNFSTTANGLTPDTHASPVASRAALRVLQAAAATALGAVYVDLYTYMDALIVAGTETQGSASWHVYDSTVGANAVHLNNRGGDVVAAAIDAAIVAQQPTWIAALS
jgi:hypothetical protein